MATESVNIKVQVDAGDGVKNVGNIRRELKEANAELVAAQRNFGEYSAEAVAAAKRVAQLRDAVQEARETADLFDPGKKFQAFTGVLNSVAGGFAAVQGALGLIGVESAEVEKQLLKVQSALALSQGLSTITDSFKDFQRLAAVLKTFGPIQQANAIANRLAAATMAAFGVSVNTTSVAFQVLKGAIAATGIGLLVVAIGSVVQAFNNYTSAAERAKKSQEEFNKATKNLADVGLAAETKAIERNQKLIEAQAKAQGKSQADLTKIQQDGIDARIRSQQRYLNEVKGIDEVAAEQTRATIRDLEAERQILQLNAQADERKRAEEAAKERKARGQQAAKDAAEAEKARLEAIRAQQDAFDAAEKERLTKSKQQIDDANKVLDEARKEQELNRLEGRERELRELEFQYLEQLKAAEGNFLALRALEEAYRINRKEVNDKFDVEERDASLKRNQDKVTAAIATAQAETEAAKKAAADQIEIDRLKTQAQLENAGKISGLLGSLSGLLGKQTAAGKVAAIAQATIDTYLAAVKAYQSLAGIPVVGPALGAAAAGVAVAAGFKNIRAITAVQVPGGGGGAAPSAPGISNPTAPLAPALPLTQTVTQLQSGTINQLQSATTRAYVVESDVTGSQERIQRLNRAARLG